MIDGKFPVGRPSAQRQPKPAGRDAVVAVLVAALERIRHEAAGRVGGRTLTAVDAALALAREG